MRRHCKYRVTIASSIFIFFFYIYSSINICNNCFLSIRKGKFGESSIENTPFGKGLVIKQIASHGFSLAWNNRCAVIILVRFLHLKKFPRPCFFIYFPCWLFKRTDSWFLQQRVFSMLTALFIVSVQREWNQFLMSIWALGSMDWISIMEITSYLNLL